MGFLDKAKQLAQQAETQLNQATGQVGGAQNARAADAWLKELGQWVYAERMGRDPRAAAEIEVRIQQLQQWEQQNGTQVQTPFPSPGTAPGGMAPTAGPGADESSSAVLADRAQEVVTRAEEQEPGVRHAMLRSRDGRTIGVVLASGGAAGQDTGPGQDAGPGLGGQGVGISLICHGDGRADTLPRHLRAVTHL